jgi:hypothetical protein
MLTNYWRAGRFSGVLPLLNGGTGSATQNFVDLTNTQSIGGAKTLTSSLTGTSATFSNEVKTANKYLWGTATNGTTGQIATDNTNNYFDYLGDLFFRGAPGSNTLMTLTTAGRLSLGELIPTQVLHVVGNGRFTAVGSASSNNSALYVTDGGVLSTNSSDVNKKHNIRNLPYGLNTINQLNPVAFDWNENDITDIGFIAQDIESIIPESVITNWDSQLIFRQEKIVPILVKAIQEQQALIKALEQRIINLENK